MGWEKKNQRSAKEKERERDRAGKNPPYNSLLDIHVVVVVGDNDDIQRFGMSFPSLISVGSG